jgi:zinc ribbon protein
VANYLAAILIVAAVALFVAAPLSGGFPRRRRSTTLQLELERLEHERGLAVQGLRELEFDHEMGKLDEVDYHDLKRSLADRALSAMSAIERARGDARAATMRLAARPARTSPASVALAAASPTPTLRTPSARRQLGAVGAGLPLVNFCPQCGARVGTGHNFCAECGANLSPVAARTASRAE